MIKSEWPFPSLTAIAAVGENAVIGDGDQLLWHLPEDFGRFKRVTMGGVLIMGRRTYDSLGGALPGRTSIVLTRSRLWKPSNTRGSEVVSVSQIQQIGRLLAVRPEQRWWSIGGGEIYRVLWPYTTHLDLTEVRLAPKGQVTFPQIDPVHWRQTSREPRDEFDFVTYERIGSDAVDALGALTSDAV
ncbi:MAG: dihydrofolate reductase [Propionibacteriaceae bacterium]|jgi:dihydrofolate reductase|nr:dihydrofolate reductase [Propionibacteriaceae bacterium]